MPDPIFYMSVKNLLLVDVLGFAVALAVMVVVIAVLNDALRYNKTGNYVAASVLFFVWSLVLLTMVTAFNGYVIYGFFTSLQSTAGFGDWILIAAFITMNLIHLFPAYKSLIFASTILDQILVIEA